MFKYDDVKRHLVNYVAVHKVIAGVMMVHFTRISTVLWHFSVDLYNKGCNCS